MLSDGADADELKMRAGHAKSSWTDWMAEEAKGWLAAEEWQCQVQADLKLRQKGLLLS